MSLSQNFRNSTLGEYLPSNGSSIILSHVVNTVTGQCKGPSIRFVAGLSGRFLAKMVDPPTLVSSLGCLNRGSSCAFWISHEDHGSTDVVILLRMSISIRTFLALEQCLAFPQGLRDQTLVVRSAFAMLFRNHTPQVFGSKRAIWPSGSLNSKPS
ncbi:hypothetical protein AVEN_83517-1 [Araneus ventricosus]|uniref:Uncharacterized protein n=1 Tax=Araneus ventricosus TaxID=182803 RepID=A0A4Y2TT99_ARAVE|nr:hypothetical protein AVEN_83517-1 [Araneus ventricosus]